MFPILDAEIKEKVLHYLDVEFADNVKSSHYLPDGSYEKEDLRGKKKVNSQEIFAEEARQEALAVEEAEQRIRNPRVFQPML